MKILDQDLGASSTVSYAGLIEKIEILRSALRWASKLDRPDIEKLLRQAGALRQLQDELVPATPSRAQGRRRCGARHRCDPRAAASGRRHPNPAAR